MQIKLNTINVVDNDSLLNLLKTNGESHNNFRLYTSMERALGFLVTGHFYLSDGRKWNDKIDRENMRNSGLYSACFSWASESVAMWMLYGCEKGAMLNYPPNLIKYLLNTERVEIGYFSPKGVFESKKILEKSKEEFYIYIADVIYQDPQKNNRVRLTWGDEHITTDMSVLNNSDIVSKNFAWSYERECRLSVKPAREILEEADSNGWDTMRIIVPERFLSRLRKGRLIRSPIYAGGTDAGCTSALDGCIDWDIWK